MKSSGAAVRLDPALMQQAAEEGARQHRTAPKQIEYWAALGKAFDGVLSREDAIGLRVGLLRLQAAASPRIDPETVSNAVEISRAQLSGLVTRARIAYQVSEQYPGYLEQVHADGRVVVGQYENGSFHPRHS